MAFSYLHFVPVFQLLFHHYRLWWYCRSSLSRVRATGPIVTSCIENAAQANAARVALEKGTVQLTYAELMTRAGRVAAVAEKVVKPGDVVCVCSRPLD